MNCNGCRTHVEEALKKVKGVTSVIVDLDKAEAVIEMESHIPLETFQEVLKKSGGNYGIYLPGDSAKMHGEQKPEAKSVQLRKGSGVYYCPMHCEGEKTYDKPGNCPVCGMDLVEQPSANTEEEDKTYKTLLYKFKIATFLHCRYF